MQIYPSFKITNKILALLQSIAHELGVMSGAKIALPPIKLRKNNQIKTIQSSLAIEGNTLSIDQVTDILDGKRVLAPQKDIIEVKNAIRLYDNLNQFDPLSIDSLLKAHQILMQELIIDNGQWRKGGVAIFKGHKVTHIAPKANKVPLLMANLFAFIEQNNDLPWLIKACVFHYELEFIHPFSDGNGRIGRIWQQLLLKKANTIFEYISVEALIKDNQAEYYTILASCDVFGTSTLFIEFMAEIILAALRLYTNNTIAAVNTAISRLEFAKIKLGQSWFSRKDYILTLKNISPATASRDLNFAIKERILASKGSHNQTYYRFKLA